MIICFLAAICPEDSYKGIEHEISIAAYRFNKMMAEGLSHQSGVKVNCVVSAGIQTRIASESDSIIKENDVDYYFFKKRNRNSYVFYLINLFSLVKKWMKEDEVIIIADALVNSASVFSWFMNSFQKVRTVGIVTDLPQYVGLDNVKKRKMKDLFSLSFMKRFSSYVLLTEQMNSVVNMRKKPYIVMEGICDGNSIDKSGGNIKDKKIIMYAGSLHRQYGIRMLMEAFIKCNRQECELHIYGCGNSERDIEEASKFHNNIVFHGLVSHDRVVLAEQDAFLLVNPRPSNEEFVKYSFPSKTLEYMASGTPVVMNKLPGIPKDYQNHVLFFEDETVEGYTKTLDKLLAREWSEMRDFGYNAKRFIVNTRNKDIQAEKIISKLLSAKE